MSTTIPHRTDTGDRNDRDNPDRHRCAVVGVYCEALGWLRREPMPAAVCCRSYWADAEGAA